MVLRRCPVGTGNFHPVIFTLLEFLDFISLGFPVARGPQKFFTFPRPIRFFIDNCKIHKGNYSPGYTAISSINKHPGVFIPFFPRSRANQPGPFPFNSIFVG